MRRNALALILPLGLPTIVLILSLIFASMGAWFLSSLIGGGSPLILIPVISSFLGAAAVPPVLTTGMLFGNGQRVWLYWGAIDWRVVAWCLPGATVGAVLGAFAFSRTQIEGLSLLLALFLLTSVFGLFGQQSRQSDRHITPEACSLEDDYAGANRPPETQPHWQIKAWYFLPVGLLYAFFSGLIGSTGPVLHPLYLNYGLTKEAMLATKSFNVLGVHIVKLIAYGAFGVLTQENIAYGLIIGVAALPGNALGQWVLAKMSEQQFRQLVILFVGSSGLWMLWQQRQFFTGWAGL